MTEPRYTAADLAARIQEVRAACPDIPERIVIVVSSPPEPPSSTAELASSVDDGA